MLNKYNGRYYVDKKGRTKLLNSKSPECQSLIGTTVHFRSPITCACGDQVCHKCFGTTSLLNLDIADGSAGFESEEVTKVVNQLILSSKHLLTTDSEKIVFNDDFYKFFNLCASEIDPIINNESVENIDDYAVWINPTDICKADELDDDSSSNTYIDGRFYVKNMVTQETYEIHTLEEKDLFLTEECLELIKKGKGYARFKDMDDNTKLFELDILNNELTKPLYELMSVLNNSKTTKSSMSYHEMAQRFTELILSAGIDALALAGELIINRLIRNDPDEDFSRPDFSNDYLGKYQIVTLRTALTSNKSSLVGLAAQYLKKQLLSDDLITKKDGTSFIDPVFRKTTSTKRLRDMYKASRKQ